MDTIKENNNDIYSLATELDSNAVAMLNPGEIVIGSIVKINSNNKPLVNFFGNPEDSTIEAISTVSILAQHIGRQVALLFSNADITKPVIVGLIHNPLQEIIDNYQSPLSNEDVELWQPLQSEKKSKKDNPEFESRVDGKRVVIEGKEEIVLRCGDASITLTKAGKILIRGKYLSNRSSGVNRIMGGSVQIN